MRSCPGGAASLMGEVGRGHRLALPRAAVHDPLPWAKAQQEGVVAPGEQMRKLRPRARTPVQFLLAPAGPAGSH